MELNRHAETGLFRAAKLYARGPSVRNNQPHTSVSYSVDCYPQLGVFYCPKRATKRWQDCHQSCGDYNIFLQFWPSPRYFEFIVGVRSAFLRSTRNEKLSRCCHIFSSFLVVVAVRVASSQHQQDRDSRTTIVYIIIYNILNIY